MRKVVGTDFETESFCVTSFFSLNLFKDLYTATFSSQGVILLPGSNVPMRSWTIA